MDRRTIGRVRSRLRVQFEANDVKGIALTADISPDGCLLHSSAALRPGTRLRGRILLEGKTPIAFDGEVRWAQRVDWALGQQYPNSAGVSFATPPGEAYYQHLQARAEAVQ
ncbi:MAG: PilZ domain-containing protein [Myxococcales bacterium]